MARIRQYPPEKDSVRAREERKGQALTERKVKNRDELDARVRRYVRKTMAEYEQERGFGPPDPPPSPPSFRPTGPPEPRNPLGNVGPSGPLDMDLSGTPHTVTEDPQAGRPVGDRFDSMAADISAGNSSISDIKDAFDKRQVRKRLRSIASDVDIDTRSRRR